MLTVASASLSQELPEHRARIIGWSTYCLDLAILTGSHVHRDSDPHCSPRSTDPVLTSEG